MFTVIFTDLNETIDDRNANIKEMNHHYYT